MTSGIEYQKRPKRGNFIKAQLSEYEMLVLKENDEKNVLDDIKEKLMKVSKIKTISGTADGFKINIYPKYVDFRAHHDNENGE